MLLKIECQVQNNSLSWDPHTTPILAKDVRIHSFSIKLTYYIGHHLNEYSRHFISIEIWSGGFWGVDFQDDD